MSDTEVAAGGQSKESDRGRIVRRVGIVVSDKRDKTIAVRYQYSVKHPKYGKFIRRRTTLHTDDPKNEAEVGDKVEVAACRRLSKQKCWRLVRIIEKGAVART